MLVYGPYGSQPQLLEFREANFWLAINLQPCVVWHAFISRPQTRSEAWRYPAECPWAAGGSTTRPLAAWLALWGLPGAGIEIASRRRDGRRTGVDPYAHDGHSRCGSPGRPLSGPGFGSSEGGAPRSSARQLVGSPVFGAAGRQGGRPGFMGHIGSRYARQARVLRSK